MPIPPPVLPQIQTPNLAAAYLQGLQLKNQMQAAQIEQENAVFNRQYKMADLGLRASNAQREQDEFDYQRQRDEAKDKVFQQVFSEQYGEGTGKGIAALLRSGNTDAAKTLMQYENFKRGLDEDQRKQVETKEQQISQGVLAGTLTPETLTPEGRQFIERLGVQVGADGNYQPPQEGPVLEILRDKAGLSGGGMLIKTPDGTVVATGGAALGPIGNKKREENVGKGLGAGEAEAINKALDAGGAASTQMQQLRVMQNLLADPNVYQGAGGESVLRLKKAAKSLGFDVKGVSSAEALQSFSNKMVLALRSTANGEGMPGQMSDNDVRFLKAIPPGLGNTREGNTLLIDIMMRQLNRKQEMAIMANKYQDNPKEFRAAAIQYNKDNPIITPVDVQKAYKMGKIDKATASRLLDGYSEDILKRYGAL